MAERVASFCSCRLTTKARANMLPISDASAFDQLKILAESEPNLAGPGSFCGTCPRSRFLGSFTDHFDGLPTIRPSALFRIAQHSPPEFLPQVEALCFHAAPHS
jgi:hypothetical protein